ncbi:ABC transporter ATP-binding protein [Ruegeria hyattellae]|uniref:ABC transporter ATP-binding protein n=1 Tax=Ruegeria hyattellae TaxID=3233337 RepID=UPI00355C55EB
MTADVERLNVVDLHKHYGSLEVLKGVSLQANEGDVISMIGASGSGKSTFLRCINLLELPSAGTIKVSTEEIQFKDKLVHGNMVPKNMRQVERVRQRLAMVFQNFCLWEHMTVLQNVMEAPVHVLGLPKAEAKDKAEALLNRVGMWEKRDVYPSFMSGGQQQRVAIARSLAVDPEVMLFDEPTSALDPELVNEVLKVIRGLAEEGRTMILVTHEMRFAREVSSRVMFLHQGLIDEEGTPHQVFNDPQSERCSAFVNSIN